MVYVVSYDIADDKRRARVAKTLTDVGRRVQYSVFELDVGSDVLGVALAKVEKVLDEREDSVRVYALCERCGAAIHSLGKPPEAGWPAVMVV